MRRRRRRRRSRARVFVLVILLAVLAAIMVARLHNEAPEQEADSGPVVEHAAAITYEPAPPSLSPVPEATPEPEQIPVSRYAAVEISEDDIYTLACLVYHEARGEPFEGQVAVIEVVLNRCLSEYFPDTIEETVFQKFGDVWQFSPAPYLWTAEPGEEQYEAVYTALTETEYILTAETVYFSGSPYNDSVSAVIGNHYFCEID